MLWLHKPPPKTPAMSILLYKIFAAYGDARRNVSVVFLQVMYIMAAVDIDVREVAKVAKARAAAANSSGRGIGGVPGPRRAGSGGEGVCMHEQVVCSIKAHQNGTLEIAPGMSAHSSICSFFLLCLLVFRYMRVCVCCVRASH